MSNGIAEGEHKILLQPSIGLSTLSFNYLDSSLKYDKVLI